MDLGQVDIHFMGSVATRNFPTVNDWKIEIQSELAIYTGFSCSRIN
jgi:hypothetical protein